MKIDKLKITEKELGEDFQRINELALTVKEDLENGEATLAEFGTYIRCCIKRINLIKIIVWTIFYLDYGICSCHFTIFNGLK